MMGCLYGAKAVFLFQLTWPENIFYGLLVVVFFVFLSIISGKIDVLGGLLGGLMAFMLFLGGGFVFMGYLFLFFVLGSAASAFKISTKEQKGLAEKNKGKRSIGNALANGTVASVAGLGAWLWPEVHAWFHIALAAAFASATSDTLSSEIGNVLGSRYYHILTFKRFNAGPDGIVSLEGSLAGIVGSLIIAIAYSLVAQDNWGLLVVFLSGIVGNLSDSLLGATLQWYGWLNNHMVNFMNTLIAAVFGVLLY